MLRLDLSWVVRGRGSVVTEPRSRVETCPAVRGSAVRTRLLPRAASAPRSPRERLKLRGERGAGDDARSRRVVVLMWRWRSPLHLARRSRCAQRVERSVSRRISSVSIGRPGSPGQREIEAPLVVGLGSPCRARTASARGAAPRPRRRSTTPRSATARTRAAVRARDKKRAPSTSRGGSA